MLLHVYDSDGDVIANWTLNLQDGEISGVESLTYDFLDEKRFTRFKKLSGARYRRIKPRDRRREHSDLGMDGWLKDSDLVGQLNFLSKKDNVAIQIATNQMIWFDSIQGGGTATYVDPDIKSSAWYAGLSGSEATGSVTTDTSNYISADYNTTDSTPGSVSYTQGSPSTNTYRLYYKAPTGMDWSMTSGKGYVWFYSTIASTSFTNPRIYLATGSDFTNSSYWDLAAFDANTWTEEIIDLGSPDGTTGTGVTVGDVDIAALQVTGKSVAFTINMDLFGAYGEDANGDLTSRREIPFWSIEKGQIGKNGPGKNWTYRLQFKRTKSPPW